VNKVNAGEIPKSSNNWKIASYISFVVIVGLIVLSIIPRTGKKELLEKSIAVLPFENDSPEEICKSLIRLNRPWAQSGLAQFDLALIYAFRGEKSKAMEKLRDLHQRSDLSYFIMWYVQSDPMLDSIRDDPEFQQIAKDPGVKLAAGINRVRQWLEENEMLSSNSL